MYLAEFGVDLLLLAWLTISHAAPITAQMWRPSVQDTAQVPSSRFLQVIQRYIGQEAAGVINIEEKDVMRTPTCGVEDVSEYEHYPGRPKWGKDVITYRITQYTPDLTQAEVDATIAQAFKLYSDVIPLDFKQIYWGTADITILFQSGFHGDDKPFDGPEGILAHATSPGQGRVYVHFDEDETWTLSSIGINLLLVAAHEFGHSLGLDHSNDRNSLMFKDYSNVYTYGYKLPDDDVRGVQALYGVRAALIPPPPIYLIPYLAPLPNPHEQQCCPNIGLDATTHIWGDLYYFKNGYYWRKSLSFPEIIYAQVSTMWPQINYVDAAYEVPSAGEACLFEGHQYWCINSLYKTILPGYPQPISNFGLPFNVNKVDAAFYEPLTRRVYVFVNDQYWSFDTTFGVMDYGYPRYISLDFQGIGPKVDAALENYGYLYFNQGSRQIQYYMPYRRVTNVIDNYEWLPSVYGWYGIGLYT